MYHAPSRNIRLLRKIGILFLTWIIVIGGVVLLTALTLGYGFNREKGTVERSGILQIGSRPGGASVTINDRPLGTRTPAKVVSTPGDYALEINYPGYKTWQKTVPIRAGGLTWATYPRLVPEKLTPAAAVPLPDTLADALPSPGSAYYGFIPKADTPRVLLAKINADAIKQVEVAIPNDVYTPPAPERPGSAFSLERWSADERRILLKHTYGADQSVEWILLDHENPDSSVNLSRLFGVTIEEVQFANGDGSKFYALSDGAVRLFDIANETIGRPLVQDVRSYSVFDDDYILFVSEPTEQETQQVGYVRQSYERPRVIDVVPYDGAHSALAAVGKYYDKFYFLITHGTTATLSQSNSLSGDASTSLKRKLVTTMKLESPILYASIAGGGQFAIIQDGASFATHNLEIEQTTHTALRENVVREPQKLRHLEAQLLWAEHNGKLRTYEFDGANQHDIMAMEARFSATFSPQGKYLYAVQKTADGYSLSRVQFLDIE